MKFLLGMALLIGAGAAVLHFTGAFKFNPTQQAQDVIAQIKPGMDYKKVAGISTPRKYCIYVKKTKSFGGETIEYWAPGPDVPYDEAALAARVNDGSLGGGFMFRYNFSQSDMYEVTFDQYGAVISVDKNETLNKLFDR
ncbi:MAG: hypothetical protein H6817_00155 [Phycisphaerales bacterium]|nr:hypothetical protein [Phycisphaerales bacterium]